MSTTHQTFSAYAVRAIQQKPIRKTVAMRDYGKVFTSFWESQNIRAMSEDGRALAMYLLTCPHGTISGAFRLPDGYVCEDIQWPSERVSKGFNELLANGFATRCEATKWVWIAKHLEWNPPENPNQKKAAAKMAAQIPDECCWKPAFIDLHGESLGIEWKKQATLQEPFRNPSLTSSSSSKQEQNGEPSASASPLADIPVVKKSTPAIEFKTFMSSCKATGEDPVPENDPVFDWADKAGIPLDFLRIAWVEFRSRYHDSSKKYRDWRKVFRNAVRDNWFKLWFCDGSGAISLTTQGRLLQKTHDAEAA